MNDSLMKQFDRIFALSLEIFTIKQKDYGPTWVLFRYSSLVDEIWCKAKRIRTLEEQNDESLIPEGRDSEYIGIINYCVMFLIRLESNTVIPGSDELVCDLDKVDSLDPKLLLKSYNENVLKIKTLLFRKNSDYGDAWKSMSISSMTDQIIIRVYRIKTILKNGGVSGLSEGISSQLQDIVNYCVFALIKMDGGAIS